MQQKGSDGPRAAHVCCLLAAVLLLGAQQACASAGAATDARPSWWMLPFLPFLALHQALHQTSSSSSSSNPSSDPTWGPPKLTTVNPNKAIINATVLAVSSDSGWHAFDPATGEPLKDARLATGKRAANAGAIRIDPGDRDLLFTTASFGDPLSLRNYRGYVQTFARNGGSLRRFDKRHPGFELRRPSNFLWIEWAPFGSGEAGGKLQRQLVVAAVGNDALPVYDSNGQLSSILARGDNTTGSMQGPRGLALDKNGSTLYVTTQGSFAENDALKFPQHLRSALLAVSLETGHTRLIDALPPPMGTSSGNGSGADGDGDPLTEARLVGLDFVPSEALEGVALSPPYVCCPFSSGPAVNGSGSGSGSNNDSRISEDLLVVSDTSGVLRWYLPSTGDVVHSADAGVLVKDPKTGEKLPLEFGELRAQAGYLYVAAFDKSEGADYAGYVLRFGQGGAPAGRRGEGDPVWIGPSALLRQATGLAVL